MNVDVMLTERDTYIYLDIYSIQITLLYQTDVTYAPMSWEKFFTQLYIYKL